MTVIAARRVLTGTLDLADAWVQFGGDTISAVGTGAPPEPPAEQLDGWLLPGFVDVHVHGGGGGSFSRAQVAEATRFHLQHGTTTMLASLVSEPVDALVEQVTALLPYVESGAIAGIHLEGPFIAAARCGAHDTHVLRNPDAASVHALLAAGGAAIKMVTLAPELPGALAAIALLAERGIIAALGHSDAHTPEALAGIDAGATQVT